MLLCLKLNQDGAIGYMRVPSTGPREQERQRLIRKFEADLRRLQRIPLRRREAEHADIAEQTCRTMLANLYAGLPLVPDLVVSVDDPLKDILDGRG
jgi:hypothetical protein